MKMDDKILIVGGVVLFGGIVYAVYTAEKGVADAAGAVGSKVDGAVQVVAGAGSSLLSGVKSGYERVKEWLSAPVIALPSPVADPAGAAPSNVGAEPAPGSGVLLDDPSNYYPMDLGS